MQKEKVLAYWFYEAPIERSNWRKINAPDEVLATRNMYQKMWSDFWDGNTSVVRTVSMYPILDAGSTGWMIKLTIRPKASARVTNVRYSAN